MITIHITLEALAILHKLTLYDVQMEGGEKAKNHIKVTKDAKALKASKVSPFLWCLKLWLQ